MIRLQHEIHGFHDAYNDVDAKACEKNGWKRVTSNIEKPATLRSADDASILVNNESIVPRRGRPPNTLA